MHVLGTFTRYQSFSTNTWLNTSYINIHESAEISHSCARAIQYYENCGAGFGVEETHPLVANGVPWAPLLP